MSTTTTNLSLVKPANNENVDISVINDNYDKIDQFAGGVANVTANPSGTATETLSKLTVGSTIYGIPVGSTVSATPIVQSGTKIATITINSTDYDLYTPNDTGDTVTWNQIQLTGTKIASISINGVATDIYAPNSGGTTVVANPQGSATTDLNTVQIGNVIYAIPSGGGGYEPTGESYTFMASGSTAQGNIELDCSWTDGTTTEMRVIGDYTNLISGWGNRDYKNIRTNWDVSNQCWKLISLSGDFECDGSYAGEGEVVATIASGNKVLNVVTPTPSPSVVTWTQVQATGTKIATITIDGTPTDVYAPTSSGASTFAGLSDVDLTSLADGQVAVYNGSTSKWENETLSLGDTVSYTDLQQSGTKIGTLTINGTGYDLYAPTGGGSASSLDDLSDVTLTTPSNGQVLKYDGANSRWINANETGGGASDLDDLTDVDITSATTGQTLVYNSTTSKWENEDLVVANPQGSASAELEKLQIGNTIYSLPSGSGSGLQRTNLYTASTTETTISLSQSIQEFDFIEFVAWYNYGGNDYTQNAIYSADDLVNSISTDKIFGVFNDAWFTYYRVNDVDELECIANNNSWYIKEVYGYKFSGGGSASWTDYTGTLTAGQTSITIPCELNNDADINVYTSAIGVDYNSLTVSGYSYSEFMDGKIVVRENLSDNTDIKLFVCGLTKESSFLAISDNDLLAYLSDIASGYLKGCSSYNTADSTTQTGIFAIGNWGNGIGINTYNTNWSQYKGGTFYGVIDLNESPVSAQGNPPYQSNQYSDPYIGTSSIILTFDEQQTDLGVKVRVS